MNPEFFMSQLRVAAVAIIAYLAGTGRFTPADASLATALVTSLGPIIVPWVFSIYSTYGTKKVPHDAIAIVPDPNGTQVTGLPSGKIVGALAAMLILAGAMTDAKAQNKTVGMSQAQVQAALASVLQKINDDSAAALKDAQDHNDSIAADCWQAINTLSGTQLAQQQSGVVGLMIGIQKLRDVTRLNASPQGTDLIRGCAALVQDTKINFVQFFTNIGATVLLKGIIPLP